MDALLQVAAVVGPVFGVAAIGYIYGLRRQMDLPSLTDVLFYVFAPALVFGVLAEMDLEPSLLARVVGGALAVMLGGGALAWIVLRAMGRRSPGFQIAVMFGNNGNMGMPIGALAFGDHGLALASLYFVTSSMTHFSVGVSTVAGPGHRGELLRVPLLYAAAAALAVNAFGIHIHPAVMRGIELLGAPTIPVMLFSLGYRLRDVRLQAFELALLATVLRMGGGLAIGTTFAWATGLEGAAYGVLVLQAAMPSAVMNFVLAEKYHQDPELVSSAVALSTFASLVTVPLLLAWVM